MLTIEVGSRGKIKFPEMEVGTKVDERNTRGETRREWLVLYVARRVVSRDMTKLQRGPLASTT